MHWNLDMWFYLSHEDSIFLKNDIHENFSTDYNVILCEDFKYKHRYNCCYIAIDTFDTTILMILYLKCPATLTTEYFLPRCNKNSLWADDMELSVIGGYLTFIGPC